MGITPIPATYGRESLRRRDDALAVDFENREAEGSGGNARASRTWKGAIQRKSMYFRCAPDSKLLDRAILFLRVKEEGIHVVASKQKNVP